MQALSNEERQAPGLPSAAASRGLKLGKAWTHRVGGLCVLPDVLDRCEVDADAALARVGIARSDLSDPEARLPFATVIRALNEATRVTGCPHFGIQVGQQWRLDHMGLLGELMKTGPTIGDALRNVVVNQSLFSEGVMPFLIEYSRTIEFGFAALHAEGNELSVLHDCVVSGMVAIVRQLCGEHWSPTEVRLPRVAPLDERPYRAYFRCPVKFSEERAAVYFSPLVLNEAAPRPDPLRRHAIELEARRTGSDDHLSRVSRQVWQLILEQRPIAMASLASRLQMNERTLHRRLQREGVTFRKVLDGIRFDVARNLLRDTHRSVGEIGGFLGYSDLTAFSRSFRRWAGVSAAEWRSRHSRFGHGGRYSDGVGRQEVSG